MSNIQGYGDIYCPVNLSTAYVNRRPLLSKRRSIRLWDVIFPEIRIVIDAIDKGGATVPDIRLDSIARTSIR
jgi:hypothetical protein